MTTHPLPQRIMSGVLYLIVLFGLLYMIGSLITYPIFPWHAYLFLIPSAAALIAAWPLRFARFLRDHAAQALTLQACGLILGAVPWLMRLMAATGALSERWFYTGMEGNGVNSWWSLMTLILAFGGVVLFSMCCEASIQAFSGKTYRCPGLGKLTVRLLG